MTTTVKLKLNTTSIKAPAANDDRKCYAMVNGIARLGRTSSWPLDSEHSRYGSCIESLEPSGLPRPNKETTASKTTNVNQDQQYVVFSTLLCATRTSI